MKVINRIKKSEDFLFTIKKGRSYRKESFVIHVIKNNLSYTRVGISASTKLGNAVVRNRIRRQIRSMCRALIDFDNYSFDIVIIAKQPFLLKSYNENISLLNEALTKQIGIN